MINKILNRIFIDDANTIEVYGKTISSSIVKVLGLFFGLVVSVFLGRILGANGLGIINLSNRVVTVILILSLLGMRQVIVKEVAIGHNKKDWKHVGNVMYTAYILNGIVGLIISVVLILSVPWLIVNIFHEPALRWPMIIAFAVMTPQIFSRIFSAGINGYRKIWQSNLVDQTLSAIITAILLMILWLDNVKITVVVAALAFAFGRIVVTVSTYLYWKRLFNFNSKRSFVGKKLLRTSLPLLLFSASIIIASNADAVMLGWLKDTTQVGLYAVAANLALLTIFFLNVTNSAIAPKIAILYAEQRKIEIEKMVQRVTKGLIVLGLGNLLIFFLFGKYILNIWGDEFRASYWILIILSIGQFINVATGAAGMTLIMAGEEKIQSAITFISVIMNLLLNYFLIIKYGAVGAATATAVTVASENIIKVIFVKRRLDILTIPNFIK